MEQNICECLRQASENNEAVYLGASCDEEHLRTFRERLAEELKEDDADWYAAFLSFSNGLQIENSIFLSAQEFIETNLASRSIDEAAERYLIFGSNGNIDRYVYDKQAAEPFCVVEIRRQKSLRELSEP